MPVTAGIEFAPGEGGKKNWVYYGSTSSSSSAPGPNSYPGSPAVDPDPLVVFFPGDISDFYTP